MTICHAEDLGGALILKWRCFMFHVSFLSFFLVSVSTIFPIVHFQLQKRIDPQDLEHLSKCCNLGPIPGLARLINGFMDFNHFAFGIWPFDQAKAVPAGEGGGGGVIWSGREPLWRVDMEA